MPLTSRTFRAAHPLRSAAFVTRFRCAAATALLTLAFTAASAACETTVYDGVDDAGAAPVSDGPLRRDAAPPGSPSVDAAAEGAMDAAAIDDAAMDAAAIDDAASDGLAPTEAGPPDSGAPDAASDGGVARALASGDVPAGVSYTSSTIQGAGAYRPGCVLLELGGYPGAESLTCCYGARKVVLRNQARVVLRDDGGACLEAGAASTCAPLTASATGATAALTTTAELLAVVRAWGWPVSSGALDPASVITIAPSADGARATVTVRMQTLWGPVMPSKNCMRGLGSWLHETFDVPLLPAP